MNNIAIINSIQINTDDNLMKKSWRVITPAKARSQNYQEAFQLREHENDLSFFVNSPSIFNIDERKSEILKICENRKLTIRKDAHLIMIDLLNAIDEINLNTEEGKEWASAKIDNFPHCSFIYENDSYKDDIKRVEIMNILYYNIIEDFVVVVNDDGNQCLIN